MIFQRNSGRSCLPCFASSTVFKSNEKSATNEWGLPIGSSCRIGTKYTPFRLSNVPIFFRFADIASLEASAITSGRSVLICAFAAMHTGVSVIPLASFANVFPVQGQRISISKGFLGPKGSASVIVWMIFSETCIGLIHRVAHNRADLHAASDQLLQLPDRIRQGTKGTAQCISRHDEPSPPLKYDNTQSPMISPAVNGATFPGSDSATTVFSPNRLAAS